jgi:thiopeptide-type bacteriocin biosynthesis protein
MNPMWLSLPAARFLLSIAHQHSVAQLGWSWDEFADSPTLPRVTHGRTVLALRRWNVTAAEFADLRPGTDAGGFRRLQEWRVMRGLPRLISFDHPKNRVLVDFGNVLSVDAFLAATKDISIVRFVEGPAREPSPVQGPDGRYAHELIIPFTLDQGEAPRIPRRRAPPSVHESRRRFQPGTEWLYANLYGPVAGADRVLVEHVGPLARSLREAGLVDRWFFIRYADPERHLRVRLHGRPRDLLREALPALHEATANPMAEGLLYRISLDTYEREIERYGGVDGVELMEHAAEVDSAAVIGVLGHPLSGVERRHLTVASLAGLYEDAGLTLGARHACCDALRTAWARAGSGSLGRRLGAEERSERAQLADTVAALERDDAEPRIAALRARSAALAPILGRLRALEEEGILERPFDDIMCSLAHMGVNRLLKRGANHDELRVHDALARLYQARIARADSSRRSPDANLDQARAAERLEAGPR